jgi:hypothetical protein
MPLAGQHRCPELEATEIVCQRIRRDLAPHATRVIAIARLKGDSWDTWVLQLYSTEETNVLVQFCPFCGKELPK